ncbi:MAG TPA: sugar transferase [Candidatus Dormibacteraeota bacterium]|nr:sugar transferase [Candidatus Dormibacteraeota bacterium]
MSTAETRLPRRRHFRATRYERFVKPSLDWSLSAFLLVVLAPVLLLLSIAIRLDSAGPVFFIQKRVGQYGSRFGVIRFRTLRTNSETWHKTLAHEPVTLGRESPELTRVGRFLLSSRLDRLPMLINVVRGEMSLVGPRAALPYELAHYGAVDWLRLRIKPGVACLWQLSGLPESDFRAAMALDQEYVNSLSPALDLRIAVRSLLAIAGGTAKH